MKRISLLIAVCLLAATARAIELSLEENRGDRGSVGYVDIQRLFADSPDALKAKEGFEDLVRQAEERVNLRKAELLKLHHELDQAHAERDALALVMSTTPSPSTAAAVSPAPAAPAAPPAAPAAPAAAPAAVALSTRAPAAVVALSTSAPAAIALSTASPASVALSTATTAPKHHEIALPGMEPLEAAPTAPPAVPAVATSSTPASSIAASSSTAAAAPRSVLTSTGIAAAASMFPAAPAPVPVVAVPAGPTPVQRLLEFDSKIIKLQADIVAKEGDLTHEHDNADRGLLDVESRKTDQVLATLYRAVSEVARREGVSVVIDKASILYGQPAVDLTDKVLKYLKENPAQ